MKRKKRSHGGFSRANRVCLNVIGVGVWTSGACWIVCHYFFMKQGEFGPTTNPMEPWWLKLHGLFAFGTLWLLGLVWGIHVTKFWSTKRRRWSGSVLTGLALVLVVTGYLLYYVGDDHARSVVSIIHWGLGLGVPAIFVWHKIRRRSTMRGSVIPLIGSDSTPLGESLN